MILKRYVQVENGMVYDTARESDTINGFQWQFNYNYTSINLWRNSEDLEAKQVITATADDVWELVKEGWMVDVDTWFTDYTEESQKHMNSLVKVEENEHGYYFNLYGKFNYFFYDGKKTPSNNVMSRFLHRIYSPITENGKVVRYELIWERQ